MKLAVRLVLLVCVVLALGACGGGDDSGSEGTTTAATTGGGGESGEAVFTSNCGTCHTLAAAGTDGTTGPNLDDLKPDEATVENQVRSGGGGMPAFEGQLSDAEIAAVASYVADNAGS